MAYEKVHIDIRKLADYCLNPFHPVGKHKARVFSSKLGLLQSDASLLKEIIEERMKKARIEFGNEDEFGKRISADLRLDINNRSAIVRTIWIIRTGDETPELVTCYIIS